MVKRIGVIFLLMLLVLFSACNRYDSRRDFRIAEIRSDDNIASITGYLGRRVTIRIPPRIRGQTITQIGPAAFAGKGIIDITIPDTVRSIGRNAFLGNRLTSVTLPNSLVNIREGAFGSNRLTSVTIPNSVRYIGTDAFRDNRLTSVTIPNGVREIHNRAFWGNPLTSITIGANVEFLGGTLDGGIGWTNRPFGYDGFEEAYIAAGRLAGTYTRPDTTSTTWTRQ